MAHAPLVILIIAELLTPAPCARADNPAFSAKFAACKSGAPVSVLTRVSDCQGVVAGAPLPDASAKSAELGETAFRQQLRDRVHTYLEAAEYKTAFVQACADAVASGGQKQDWFTQQGRRYEDWKSGCATQLQGARAEIRAHWARMRTLLATMQPEVDQEALAPSDMSLFNAYPAHPLAHLVPLEPLTPTETDTARDQAKEDLDQAGLDALDVQADGTRVADSNVKNVARDLFAGTLRISPEKQRLIVGKLKKIRLRHYADYLLLLQEAPDIGFISHVDLNNPGSPTDRELAGAYAQIASHLHGYLKELQQGHPPGDDHCPQLPPATPEAVATPCFTLDSTNWSEYLRYRDVLNELVSEHPQYCVDVDRLKNTADWQVQRQQLLNTGLGMAAGFVAGGVGGGAGIALGLTAGAGIGGLEVYEGKKDYDHALASHLAFALDHSKLADFAEVDEAQRALGLREYLMPLIALGTAPILKIARDVVRSPGIVESIRQADTLADKAVDGAVAATMKGARYAVNYVRRHEIGLTSKILSEAVVNADESTLIREHIRRMEDRLKHNTTTLDQLKVPLNHGATLPEVKAIAAATRGLDMNSIVAQAMQNGFSTDDIRRVAITGNLQLSATDLLRTRFAVLIRANTGGWWVIDPQVGAPLPFTDWMGQVTNLDRADSIQIDVGAAKKRP